MKRKIANTLLASSMVFSMATSQMTMIHAVDEDGIAIQDVDLETVQASYEKAIAEVKVPKYAKDGSKIDQGVSEYLKAKLDTKDLSATKEESKKLLTVDVQLKDVNLTSDYINGKSPAGISYYNMMNFFTNVKQVKQLLDANPGYQVKDSKGNVVDASYVDELLGLLQQINDFDPTTNLQYDYDSVYDSDAFASETTRGATDVIATSKEGNVSFKFHIDSHGWWGYDLGAHDSITGLVMGYSDQDAYDQQHVLTMDYGNFFVIKMKEDSAGTWYMLKNTDIQNPMIYVSKDGKEAFMIDVDFYGSNVINDKIKAVIGDKCESLKIFLTHNHPDHVNNLAVIGLDDELRNKTTIVWPENEPHTILGKNNTTIDSMVDKDLISDIAWKSVETVKDMEKFTAAGVEFQFLEISDEHTPGGGQLADLTHKVIYSGDSLGAQVHLGGTVVRSGAEQWVAGGKKAAQYIKENGIQYNIGAHTAYLNNPDFASWLATGMEYGVKVAPKGYTLIIVENGKVINGTKRYDEIMKNGLSDRDELNVCSITFIKSEDNGSAERAVRSIVLPRYESDGTKVEQHISDDLKSHLAVNDIEKVQDETQKTFTVNVQLKDVNLTSDYINGKSEPGISYYNMLSYYIDVLQVKELVDKNEGYSIIDSKGNKVDAAYVNELVGLLKQINDFDPTTDLQYDWDSAYDTEAFENETTRGATDVIATSKEGNVTLRFHIDSHGWWGYDLISDSIAGVVMGYTPEEVASKQNVINPYTKAYSNFFVIKMKEDDHGTWYMLNDTDLENPMIYVSKDGKEAFMIDVDFYGANVINDKIKAVIGDKCESLKIFMTHNHGDHVANLAIIGQDDELRNKTTIIWPENEPTPVLSDVDSSVPSMTGKDLIKDIKWKEVVTVKDMEKFTAAGVDFQFVEITGEHTPGGGQLADLTHKVIYSGDSLGAQVHLGGTTINADNAKAWIDGGKKAAKYIKENGIKYNIGAHTPYLNNPDFASWLATGVEYGVNEAPEGTTLIIVENGKVINGTDRYDEIMKNGLSDRDELNICSITFVKDKTDPDTPDQPENPDEPTKPSDKPNQPETPTKPGDTKKPDSTNTNITTTTDKTKDNVKTGDDTEIFALVGMMVLAGGTICMIKRKKHN